MYRMKSLRNFSVRVYRRGPWDRDLRIILYALLSLRHFFRFSFYFSPFNFLSLGGWSYPSVCEGLAVQEWSE